MEDTSSAPTQASPSAAGSRGNPNWDLQRLLRPAIVENEITSSFTFQFHFQTDACGGQLHGL